MKKIAKLLLPLILIAVMSGMAYAMAGEPITAVTLTRPAASATLGNGTGGGAGHLLNCSVTGGLSNQSTWNITYQAMSLSTANSSWATVKAVTLADCTERGVGDSCRNATLNLTVDHIRVFLEDANDYQFRVIVTQANDSTNTMTSAAVTGITVDNSKPAAPTSVVPDDAKYQDGAVHVEINGTVAGTNTTKCLLYWVAETPTGNRVDTMTNTGNACNKKIEFIPDGYYEYYILASDATNTSENSATKHVTIDNARTSPTAKIAASEDSGTPAEPTQGINKGAGLLAIIGLVVGAYFLFKKP